MHNVEKMGKDTLKILRFENRKIFRVYVRPFSNIMHERVNQYAEYVGIKVVTRQTSKDISKECKCLYC